MSTPFSQFCDQVVRRVRWFPARGAIATELRAHLEDHAAALEARGLDPETAARRAVEAMGNPYALGAELDAAHPPTLPRLRGGGLHSKSLSLASLKTSFNYFMKV